MTFNPTTVDDPFSQGGNAPALKFETPGQIHTITVRKVTEKNDTLPDGTPRLWPNGDPMKVYVFSGTDETGADCSLWVRGNLVKAIRDAQKAAQLASVIDTKITVRFDAYGEAKKGQNPAKLFKAKIEKVAPAASAAWDQESDF